ncbi:DsbE family thiol:disulfide interchange protein [Sphingobium sufflavum]|uniref:DsbE family thiol:disulfide interchange protein n=1 Tax=Sphingobium sufflavum TaxID=1129547 RepID=UPI001F362120|nr:DsbE family thiol:disulfide interchange protein [Sphingobium sufflavum]MCE7797402.1 DsbE family thiol:disulfide interchange protein [Sphingobium sufflavum]
MRSWLLWAPLGLFVIFIGLFASGLFQPDDRQIHSGMLGKALPAFTLPAGASDRPGLSTADLKTGKPRLLNIFASWCVPCAAESPQLVELARQGVTIDGVAIRDAREDVDGFLKRWGNPYGRIGLDARSALQLSLGSSGVPESFVVDGKGIIRYQHIGEIRPEHIAVIRQKLAEAAQ